MFLVEFHFSELINVDGVLIAQLIGDVAWHQWLDVRSPILFVRRQVLRDGVVPASQIMVDSVFEVSLPIFEVYILDNLFWENFFDLVYLLPH